MVASNTPQRRQLEALLAEPPPVGLAPVLAREIGAPVPGEQLEHTVAPAEDVAAEVVATADKISEAWKRDARPRPLSVRVVRQTDCLRP